jgi:hypothetical protein
VRSRLSRSASRNRSGRRIGTCWISKPSQRT